MKPNDNVQKTLKLWDKEYKKGFTSYMVLVLLKDRSMYGYELKATLENTYDCVGFLGNDIT